MNIEQHIPSGELSRHIDVIFFFSGFVPDHSIERVVPTGNTFLIIELDGYLRHTYDPETLKPDASYKHSWYSGQHKGHLSISAHENSSMFVIQFNATGAYPFLKLAMDNYTEKVTDGRIVFGDSVDILRDKLIQADSTTEKFQLAESWLNSLYDVQKTAPEELDKMIEELKKKPVARLNTIVEHYPHSQKHLIGLFKKHVGLTPKVYQRILRFNEILQRIQNKEQIAWTDISYSCGYSDQSHFIKEFKHFSGFNPSEFIAQSHNTQSNFFPVDKG